MKNKRIINSVVICLLLLLSMILVSCDDYQIDRNPYNLKYKIKYGFGNTTIIDASTGEIEYLSDGKIKYESFNNGNPDTVIVGGTYLIEKYH